MDVAVSPVGPLRGTLRMPADKAICQRAVLIAALAEGRTTVAPWPEAEDCQRALALIQALGVRAHRAGAQVRIDGRGVAGLRQPVGDVSCGGSGTTLRLAAGLLAGCPFESRLIADASLSRRPMQRIVEPLRRMGAWLEGATRPEHPGEVFPPLVIRGRHPLAAITYAMPVASAQVKSAVLLAGLSAEGATEVIEPVATRDHTERLLRRCGIDVAGDAGRLRLVPGRLRAPGCLTIPGDFSSAAFFIVAACCVPGSRVVIEGVGLNPTRTGLLTLLRRMGAAIEVTAEHNGWEPRGRVLAEAAALRGIRVGAEEVPGAIDELPALMVAAACAQGTTRLEGVGELRVKETDRIQSMATGLGRLGARIRSAGKDAVEIEGAALTGAEVEAAGDHRSAMSLVVAGLAARGASLVRGAECVGKSFPDFFARLDELKASSTGKTVDKAEGVC